VKVFPNYPYDKYSLLPLNYCEIYLKLINVCWLIIPTKLSLVCYEIGRVNLVMLGVTLREFIRCGCAINLKYALFIVCLMVRSFLVGSRIKLLVPGFSCLLSFQDITAYCLLNYYKST
jgi:hypothetical protein